MAPVTSSFIRDIVQSLLDQYTAILGTGSTVYPEPAHLLAKKVVRAGGSPHLRGPDHETPAIWLEYVAGGDEWKEIGRRHAGMVETFNAYAYMVWSPETLGMVNRDKHVFRDYAEAATDTFLRRMWKATIDWRAAISDPLIGGMTNGAKVTTWAFVLTARSDLQVEARAFLRLEVNVE